MPQPNPPSLHPGAIATNPQNQETFADLLNRGRQQLATQLIDTPTPLDRLADFGNLYAMSQARGAEGFNVAKQQQVENQRAQQVQLQQLLEHEDNLSLQEREQQRLILKDLHERLKANGETSAAAAEQLTNGNANDIYKLHQNYARFLQNQGIDDDQLSPQEIINWYSNEYSTGITEGKYEGPTRELQARSPGDMLYGPTGEPEGAVPYGEGMDPRSVESRERQHEINMQERLYALKTQFEKNKAELAAAGDPVNVVLPTGETVITRNFVTYTTDDGQVKKLPHNFIIPSKDTAWDVALAAAQKGAIKEELKKHGIDPTKGYGGVGSIQGKFSHETRSMFKALTDNPGVGPWSNLKSALDSIVGGTGVGEVLGYKTSSLFPDNEENRNHLRLAKQFGKAAFILSDKYPTYEQKLVEDFFADPDTFFENPDTQVYVLAAIHDTMLDRKVYHLQAALQSVDQKSIENHMKMVTNIGAFLRMIGSPDPGTIRKFNLGPELPEPDMEATKINNAEEYNKFIKDSSIPTGTPFIDPDGVSRLKP